ncbi:DUF1223 domain-containing protein [Bradyrhizobium sp. SYSU BS000235]|uniref:DUF1223 domain-containing protein n=1 Tax=Bradyrhizobium sp. SYSU BS000235 TaxID=3411332 RepID=UPI003C755DB5
MSTRFAITLGIAASLFPVIAHASDRPVVVELFTSQGCSSCPPANAFLNELSKSRQDLLPLAFHVTYWDGLGWKDPFSLQAATDRQGRYGKRFGDGSYTPEMVIDGAVGLVGSYRGEVNSAIEKAKLEQQTSAEIHVGREGPRVAVKIGAGKGEGTILLIGFDHQHTTAIGRGENSGRTLTETNLVRSVRTIGRWSGAAVTLHEPLPDGEDVAVLLEDAQGHIVGASRLTSGPV